MLRPLFRSRSQLHLPDGIDRVRAVDEQDGSEMSAVELVDQCLNAAIDCGASDVHFQPRRTHWDVSMRLDGVLQAAVAFQRSEDSDPVHRLMSLAGLPSYLSGTPQEGSFRFTHQDGAEHELRLGVFPTVHGHRAVLRLMKTTDGLRKMDQLGLDPQTLRRLEEICETRDGWLLVAGPAGSGKTTTLYACLAHIAEANATRSVMTIEDPVESVIDSISQSQLQPSSGLTLSAALKAAVRQDAEVLLVSEIRDEPTAEAVLSASMTGHLCFSSIHAASIGTTLRRLIQMRLPHFAIRSGLRGVLCQRLLRRKCVACNRQRPSDRPNCEVCHGTGYVGRFPIAQLIDFQETPLDDHSIDLQSAQQIDRWVASCGIKSLREIASHCIESGLTDEHEVFRVLGSQDAGSSSEGSVT